MDYLKYLSDNYKEDGFIYCIRTGLKVENKEIVKCGRVEMKREENEIDVVEKVLRRYNTYYTDCEIIHWKRVGNNKKAEKRLFEKLKELHYEKEKFIYDDKIENIFNEVEKEFPCIENILEKVSIENQTLLNRIIRQKEGSNNSIFLEK